jgi:hypothetical protein
MPKQKDLKRLARTRMEKTGESYTAARTTLLAKKARRTPAEESTPPEPPTAAPQPPVEPPENAALAGVSEKTILAKTGHGWRHWVEALDAKGALDMSHGEIAELVHQTYGISGWWAQTVTVGYERIKGLREIGQRRDGAFEATKSKTLPVSIDAARRAFTDATLRAYWLPDDKPTLRKTTSPSSLRFTWEDGTAVDVWLTAKGDAKTQVAVAHRKLATKAEAEKRKVFWGERLGVLGEVLTPKGGDG